MGSSSPTPNPNQWNIGIPGSAAEHATVDSRFTAPLDLWSSEDQTPKPTHGDGLQDDDLDGYMDRHSYIEPTPTARSSPNYAEFLDLDLKMEEDE